MLKEIHLMMINHLPEKKTYIQKNQIKKEKYLKSSLLMTMSGYVQTVVKFGMITEIADG